MDYLTVREVAQALGLSPLTVRRHIASGSLSAVRVGGRVRVPREALDRFITPVRSKPARSPGPERRGQRLTKNDPLWELVGAAPPGPPTDSSRKYEYLADAAAPLARVAEGDKPFGATESVH